MKKTIEEIRSSQGSVSGIYQISRVQKGKGGACSSNVVVLSNNTLRVYGFAVFYQGGAPTRLGSSVADAGSAYMRLHPSPARTSTTAAFHPARGADPEMHPCPASVLSWTLCSGPLVAQSSVGANQLQSRPAQELGALHVTARH
jgi:hypothetical protein